MVKVHEDFVRYALQARYDEVVTLWGKDASIALWEQALDLLCDTGDLDKSPQYYVDNYLVNGDFIYREDTHTNQGWEVFCENNALIWNDKYACLGF